MSFEILRKAEVDAVRVTTKDGDVTLGLKFADGRTHQFHPKSREAELLDIFGDDMAHITDLFSGGTYAFHDSVLVDYRSPTYRGFIHSDDAIKNLIERVGIDATRERKSVNAATDLFGRLRGRHTNGVFLGGEWDKFDLSIPSLGVGGEFTNRLLFRWSPFSPHVMTSLEIERLVCSNGMVAMSPLVVNEVPVIDNWEENLNVVAMQFQPRVNALLADRFTAMEQMRASVADVQRVHETLVSRMGEAEGQSAIRLARLQGLTDVNRHLSRYYEPAVFENRNLGDRAESHMTQFALFNVLTEAATHTRSSQHSDSGIQVAINRLVFDDFGRRQVLESRRMPEVEESNPERAFFSSASDDFSPN